MAQPVAAIDMSEVKKLGADLRAAGGPEMEKEFRASLAAATEVVAIEARSIASRYSTRIPGTIKVKYRGYAVDVQAGGNAAPHAAPFEHGGIPGVFEHPTFGHTDRPAKQEAHPFLTPALVATAPALVEKVLLAVDVGLARRGL